MAKINSENVSNGNILKRNEEEEEASDENINDIAGILFNEEISII